jgi:hypothetical protein
MDAEFYLDKFQSSVDGLDIALFEQKNLELKVGVWRNSAVLKMQKKAWLNTAQTSKSFEESVFFSIWISDEGIQQSKLYYNIHALKLRELTKYTIKSREFAEAFRLKFKHYEKEWLNVSTSFGPLTLMEGWVTIDPDNFEETVSTLAYKFLAIAFIIDKLLEDRSK